MHTKTSTRRAVLAGIAAVPALAGIAAGAALAAPDLSNDDVFAEEMKRRWDEVPPETKALVRAFALNDASADDPILAAIEEHKAAFQISQEAGRVRFRTVDAKRHPAYDPIALDAATKADDAAQAQVDATADALATIKPTTVAGVLALIRYVEAFNSGEFFLEADSQSEVHDWRSATIHWPRNEDADDEEDNLFGYTILANVRRALEAMAVS